MEVTIELDCEVKKLDCKGNEMTLREFFSDVNYSLTEQESKFYCRNLIIKYEFLVNELKMNMDDGNCLKERNIELRNDAKIMKRDVFKFNTRCNNLRSECNLFERSQK